MAELLAGIRIAVIEDHALLAQSLRLTLRAEGADVRAVELSGQDDAVAECLRHRPDIVLLDLDLGPLGGDGATMIAPLVAGGATVLVLTGSTERARLGYCIEAGASGVIEKTEELKVLVEQVRRAAASEQVLSAQRRHDLLLENRHEREARQRLLAPFESLTDREADVLAELMHGRRADEIAHLLFVSQATVRTHIRGILLKLNVRSQLAAVAQARAADWQPAARHRTAS